MQAQVQAPDRNRLQSDGENKPQNKGQETHEQKLFLFPGGGTDLGSHKDHNAARPGWSC